MEIPIDIPRRIRPDINNPVHQSVIYTFQPNDVFFNEYGELLYHLPYSKDTFWTNFRFSAYKDDGSKIDTLNMSIILRTAKGEERVMTQTATLEAGKWHDTTWPIPSVRTVMLGGAVYLKVNAKKDIKENLRIHLLGFMNLFPYAQNTMLLSVLGGYKFLFRKFENDNGTSRGEIWLPETFYPAREVLDADVVGIRQIADY